MQRSKFTDANITQMISKMIDAKEIMYFLKKYKRRIGEMQDIEEIKKSIWTVIEKSCQSTHHYEHSNSLWKKYRLYQARNANELLMSNLIEAFQLQLKKFTFKDTYELITKNGYRDMKLLLATALAHTINDCDKFLNLLDLLQGTAYDSNYHKALCQAFKKAVEDDWGRPGLYVQRKLVFYSAKNDKQSNIHFFFQTTDRKDISRHIFNQLDLLEEKELQGLTVGRR